MYFENSPNRNIVLLLLPAVVMQIQKTTPTLFFCVLLKRISFREEIKAKKFDTRKT